jgi:hypothetical protein
LLNRKKIDSLIRCSENQFGTAEKPGDEALPRRLRGWFPAYLPRFGATEQGYSMQHERFSLKLAPAPQILFPTGLRIF